MDHIGKYKIIEKIGQGAMGEVYKAQDTLLNRYVAVKTMSAGIGQNEELRKRFLREAQSAARLNHPNIITLYEFGEDQGKIYMVMELLAGTDLKDLIRQGSLSFEEKIGLMEQICDGLASAHAAEVVHRDLKPANIHVLPDGKVKIMDFGLARVAGSDMTRAGTVMGTPNYMSPEQVRGERADARSDIFSLGAVFYELLANRKAFEADSLHSILFQVLQHEPAPVRHWVPELPEAFVPFLARALAKDPAQRFQNAGQMREALRVLRQAAAVAGDADLLSLVEPPPAEGSAPAVGRGSPGWVNGSAALEPALGRSAPPAAATPQTLSGSAATHAAVGPGGGAWRPVAYAGGGLALVGAVVATVMLWPRKPPPPPPDTQKNGVEIVTRQLVMTKLQLAQTKIEVKDFKDAATEARQVLELDPGNAEAKGILGQVTTTLEQLDDAAAEAREAVKAGDTDRASSALQRVMAIDPQHPVAAELSSQLNTRFRGQAEEARRSMRRSQAAAEQAKAGSQKAFTEAAALAREGEVLFGRGEFTVAAQKFLDSRNNFERARRAALDRVAPPPPPATILAGRPVTPPGFPPPSAVPATAPPPTAPPAAVTSATSDEATVRQVIADYERAIEQKDLALYRKLKPNLSSGEERRLQEAFQRIQAHDVRITIDLVRVDGNQATVRLTRHDTVKGKSVSPSQQTIVLVKSADAWTIRDIGQ